MDSRKKARSASASSKEQREKDDDWAMGWTLWAAFRAQRGSGDVPESHPDHQLVTWVHMQRNDYRRWKQGESTFLSKDGFQMLTRMGFNWDGPTTRVPQHNLVKRAKMDPPECGATGAATRAP